MPKTIIADTSCIILLSKIDELPILHKLFGEIVITEEIKREYGKKLPSWINVIDPKNKGYQILLQATLDKGEASAIALAMEFNDSLLILDDRKARNVADELKLRYTGTIGVILDCKQKGYIKSVKTVLKKIRKTDFRLSKEMEEKILRMANE